MVQDKIAEHMREREAIKNEIDSSDHEAVVGSKLEQYEQQINDFQDNKDEGTTQKLHTDWADVCNNPDYALQVEQRLQALQAM